MTTGREKFARLRPVFAVGGSMLALLPTAVVRAMWPLVRSLPGLGGIGVRYLWAQRLFAGCGDNVRIGPGCTFVYWDRISVGDNVSIHERTYVDAEGGITIGDDVSIAHGCSLLAFDHSWDDESTPIKYNPRRLRPIEIASDVWLGCGVRVLSGTALGSRTIVAAGAVVRSGEYERCILGGVPASEIKRL